jgi:hypothetical protein
VAAARFRRGDDAAAGGTFQEHRLSAVCCQPRVAGGSPIAER